LLPKTPKPQGIGNISKSRIILDVLVLPAALSPVLLRNGYYARGYQFDSFQPFILCVFVEWRAVPRNKANLLVLHRAVQRVYHYNGILEAFFEVSRLVGVHLTQLVPQKIMADEGFKLWSVL